MKDLMGPKTKSVFIILITASFTFTIFTFTLFPLFEDDAYRALSATATLDLLIIFVGVLAISFLSNKYNSVSAIITRRYLQISIIVVFLITTAIAIILPFLVFIALVLNNFTTTPFQ